MPLTVATDLTGQRFGLLTVLHREPKDNPRAFWRCRCDCGSETVKMGKYLLCGDTRSCGCAQKAMRARGNVKHGGVVGGMSPTYRAWRDAKERCSNPHKRSYPWYGGRGVTMHETWRHDFGAFLRDMGECPPGLTLDRIDSDGHYEPGNCRWATWSEQRKTMRRYASVRTIKARRH